MMSSLEPVIAAVLFLLAMAPSSLAQARGEDRRTAFGSFSRGTLEVCAQSSGPARITWWGSEEVVTNAPFTVPGGVQLIEDASEHVFLVSGTENIGDVSQAGVICWLKCEPGTPPAVSMQTSRVYPGIDAFQVAWNSTQNLLYVLDGSDGRLHVAPWSGPGTPLPDPSLLVVICGPAEVPVLGDKYVNLSPADDGVLAYDKVQGHRIVLAGGAWTFVPYVLGEGNTTPRWYVPGHRQVPATGAFELHLLGGAPGSAWQMYPVLEVAEQPVLAGLHPGGVENVACPAVFFDLPGRPYRIEGAGLAPQTLIPVVRYGHDVSTSALSIEQDLFVAAEFLFVGVEKFFGVHARVKRVTTATAASTLNCYLLIDSRDGLADDPVVPAPAGGVTLADPTIVQFSLELPAGAEPAMSRMGYDIPDNSALENVVLLFQLVIVDDLGQAAYTSVHGASILPASASPLLRSAAASTGGTSFHTADAHAQWVRRAAAAAFSEERLRHTHRALQQDEASGRASTRSRGMMSEILGAMRR